MREVEVSLQQYAEFILKARLVKEKTARYCVDRVRRFLAYLAERQGVPNPCVGSDGARDYLTHLAVRQRVSASTQNQAFSAIVFLCREVLGIPVEGLSLTARAKRGMHLPVVLSMPETAALLGAMRGTTRLMAALIYRGGLRVSECCELRVKDVDFDQGGRCRGEDPQAGLRPYVEAQLRHAPPAQRGWTSGRSRNTWDTGTSRPRRSTRTW